MSKRHPRMPLHLLILQMILAVALTSSSMLAATIDPPEETPTPEESETVDPRWEKRSVRAENFKSRFLLSRKAAEAGFVTETKLREERMQNRRDCRESVRKANRDQRFAKLTACMQEDLTRTMDMLKARSEVIAAVPGIGEELRGLIVARSDLLTDAIGTIIEALDTGVYQDEAELHEARKNLREKYLLPYWLLLPRMKTEQSLAWISHLLLRAKTLMESGSLSPAVTAKITESQVCLEEAETALQEGLEQKDSQEMHSIFGQAQSNVISCIKLYREAMSTQEKELAPPAEAEQEPQWPKRYLRKLPKSRNE